jgi:hypothetical protein
MTPKPLIDSLTGDPPRHEQGDPVSLEEDPAQFYPTGGTGLLDPANEAERDAGELPSPSLEPTPTPQHNEASDSQVSQDP